MADVAHVGPYRDGVPSMTFKEILTQMIEWLSTINGYHMER